MGTIAKGSRTVRVPGHDAKRRSDNRAAAIKAGKAHWGAGYSQGGKLECDEYPFAATYQGAAQAKYDPAAPKNN